MIAIRLPTEIEELLETAAKATGQTKTAYARRAILEKLEDWEDVAVAEERLAKGEKGIPLEEVVKLYGLED